MKERIAVLHQGKEGCDDPMIVNAVRARDNLIRSVEELGFTAHPVFLDDHFAWIDTIAELRDGQNSKIVFNNADIGFSYDGKSQAQVTQMLEWMNMPFTGSSYIALTKDNKGILRTVLEGRVPLPQSYSSNSDEKIPSIRFPVIVKYAGIHNSVGIDENSVVYTNNQLRSRIGYLRERQPDEKLIVEEYIEYRKLPEISVGVLGNNNGCPREILPIFKFGFDNYNGKPRIRCYESKWVEESEEYKEAHPEFVQLPHDLEDRVKECVSTICDVIGLTDYARIDFRIKDDDGILIPCAIDINANPDINDNATLFAMASHAGYSYTEFIGRIIESAIKRYEHCRTRPLAQSKKISVYFQNN